jgi:GTP pyrophosphokinase
MVKVKDSSHIAADGSINLEAWLQHISAARAMHDIALIRHACVLSQLAGEDKPVLTGVSCLQQGLTMAEILLDLHLDNDTIAAALVYNSVRYADLSLDDVREHLGPTVAKLVQGAIQMDAMRALPGLTAENHTQLENVRKMLLAMVEDMRVVVIKLAERTAIMRALDVFDEAKRRRFADETMAIYAPLANRLGIGQLKWELEDLALRYIEPAAYREIAGLLKERRIEREEYIEAVVRQLKDALKKAHVPQFEISGRVKHIYSIHRKMLRKKLSYDQIFDLNAVRILVSTVEDCYSALSIVHGLWKPIAAEFDDYIATPKPNGYRSIHTAVIGPNNKTVEVQIRTQQMHKESEHGVAAHWRYKEGGAQKAAYEAKIAWLRQVLEWQKDLVKTGIAVDATHTAVLDDRVYVFTPTGEIVELPQGATPLDFAYHIHSEVGHRCRGAKVNGTMVPLTYTLNTGEQVEVLTAKQSNPSRDWINSHLGYLKSPRAKAKVHHWFKLQDYDKNVGEGQTMLDREMQRLAVGETDFEKVAHKLHFKTKKDMLAALGGGDLRTVQVLNAIHAQLEITKKPEETITTIPLRAPSKTLPSGINIAGIGNLLTHTALCCKPVPGDAVLGYITQGRGVAIHRQDCHNMLNLPDANRARVVDVDWGGGAADFYPVDIYIYAYDRPGLVRDITTLIANEKLNLIALTTAIDKNANIAHVSVTIEIHDLSALSNLFDRIRHIPNVIDAQRQTPKN